MGWCNEEGNPTHTTILKWLRESEAFASQYARARENQGDFYADQITTIARECPPDVGEVQRARLLIDTYKWVAGKRRPKVYGDRLALDQQGAVQVVVSYGETPRLALHQDAIEAEIVSESSHNVQDGV